MQKIMIALAGASLLVLAGCEATAPTKPDTPPVAAKPEVTPVAGVKAPEVASLSEEAKAALAKAEADVKEAQAKKALWTTAQDALKAAKAAAEKNDSAAVIKNANKASEHARLGIEQTKYPLTTIPK
jgi:hypothetical protein